MNDTVRLSDVGDIAVIEFDHPPVNAISQALVSDFSKAIDAYEADRTKIGLMICAAGRTFVAGGDIGDFELPDFSPETTNALLARLEGSDRPVVVAMHGTTLGGGAEIAMACHFRVMAESGKFGLPEISLGLIPGSLGTQRLPRLVGLEAAADLLSTGRMISAAQALKLGAIDALVPEAEVRDAALSAVRALAGKKPRRSSELTIPEAAPVALDALQAKAVSSVGQPAYGALLKALIAARDLSFDVGAQVEADLFMQLVRSDASRALRYLFFAERAAARIPGTKGVTPPTPFETVGVLGAGTMGAGISVAALLAGYQVTVSEVDEDALNAGLNRIEVFISALVKRGRLSDTAAEQCRERVEGVIGIDGLGKADLVIEAVFEDMDLKKSVAAELGRVCKRGAVIATNTSTLDVDQIAAATGRPEDVVGTHFFSPAHIMKLLEVVRGAKTSPRVLLAIKDFSRQINKVLVVSGVCYGFIGNRMSETYMRENERLQLEGATPIDIDGVAESPEIWGMAMGPSRMLDMAGVDVGACTVIEWIKSGQGPTDPAYRILCRKMFEDGLHGQKTASGYYRYEGRSALPNPDRDAMSAALARECKVTQRDAIPADEILARLLYPMVNEAARILEEGIAARGSDIDVVWTSGYGFPRWRGGPLFMADEIGLQKIVDALDVLAARDGDPYGYFAVSPLLRRLAKDGGKISTHVSGA